MTEEAPHITLELRSDPRYLCAARGLVDALAARLGFSDTACCQIALALDEALANVMRHGYERQTDRPIWVYIWPLQHEQSAPELRIVIEDEARQVDPSSIKGRALEDVRPGGLGVHIIREVMDEVSYEQRPERGMRLTLVKRGGEADQQPGGETGRTASPRCPEDEKGEAGT